ncbi:MAG: class I SAM-dependent methyltransferase [Candidatus Dojkabacteria bacterium]|nr:MAG: class I SAM-dependent methyltransferase [Candidatus Dojkabacteria bacterium]
MYETIKPHCPGKILEIGSGIGNFSEHFIKDGYNITLSDIRPHYWDILAQKFKVVDRETFDVTEDNRKLRGKFNTIFALNVIEYIKNDRKAVENMRKMLQSA